MTSALLIDDTGREQIRKILEFATQPENYYVPGPKAPVPGDNPRYTAWLGTYRVVFTITRMPDQKLYRHLSVSVRANDRYPAVEAFTIVGELFGFAGPFNSWSKSMDRETQSIIAIQAYVPPK